MTKKSRKYRKIPKRALGDAPSANKENSFSNIFRSKGDFRTSTTESALRSCPPSKKRSKKIKIESGQQNQLQRFSKSKSKSELIISGKISSVSFFIPFNSHGRGYQEDPAERIIDWNNLLFYPFSSAALPYFPNEQVRRMYYYKPTLLPELRLKCRTVSESSTNSEDSFISFENDNASENHRDRSPVNLDRCAFEESDFEISFECETLPSEEESQKKKKVRFVDNSHLVTVHLIIAWDYAYRAARVSQWMTMARDAKRFNLKIQSLEPILSPVLDPEHRARIWETRMHKDESKI